MIGVLNVYKPQNMTSHDVVAIVRRALNTKKVGHTGTLDPMATGVLPICIGRATKLVDTFQSDRKTYLAEITFGLKTDTEDIWGQVLQQEDVHLKAEAIKEAIESFLGEIEQVPPMYSALKVNGKKLYELARAGKTVERQARRRTIYHIEVIEIKEKTARFYVTCSKGTYIRTLCVDIGKKLNTLAIMSSLERTETGSFHKDTAISIEAIKSGKWQNALMTVDQALAIDKKVRVSQKAKELLQNGVKIDLMRYVDFNLEENDSILVYYKDEFLALAKYKEEKVIVDILFAIKKV